MARTTDPFVGTSEPADAVIAALEHAFGASFTRLQDKDPYDLVDRYRGRLLHGGHLHHH
jgi:hypothetical protein